MLPSTFCNLDRREKAFIIASIDLKVEEDKKQNARMKNAKKKGR